MDLDKITTAEVEALLRLLTDMEREELELVMRERMETGQEGGCIDTIQPSHPQRHQGGITMTMETATLIINWVEWQYQKSSEPTPDRQPSLKKVGIKSMEVKCKNCGHGWNTRKGYKPGDFNLEIGTAVLDCPICRTTHTVTSKELH